MSEATPLDSLAEVFRGSRAQLVISPGRQAPSTIYDLQYRLAIVAAAFQIHARQGPGGRRISAAKLKLLQFVAMRPWLVSMVREWSASQGHAQLSWIASHLRRGFLGDSMHDDMVSFLLSRDILRAKSSHLVEGTEVAILERIHSAILEHQLFASERATLTELAAVKITNHMLEGW